MHQWLDPLVLVEARRPGRRPRGEGRVPRRQPPDPGGPRDAGGRRGPARAGALGLLGSRVLFVDDWVPYAERADYLLDADVGVSLHRNHLEAVFAFRTRMLDYLWAGLPVVCTRGDSFAELVEARGLGEVVPPGDPDALAAGIGRLRGDRYDACRRAVQDTAGEFTWARVAEPLVEFCCAPAHAPDRLSHRRSRFTELALRAARRSRAVAHQARTRTDTK